MRKFLNTPWRVEREPDCFVVVDAKNLIVASFSTDAEDLPGTREDEETKAYGLAALPQTSVAAQEFLDALADPAKALDEQLLVSLAGNLEAALKSAGPPEGA